MTRMTRNIVGHDPNVKSLRNNVNFKAQTSDAGSKKKRCWTRSKCKKFVRVYESHSTDAYSKRDRTNKSKHIGKEGNNALNDYPNLNAGTVGLTKRIGLE